MDDWKIAVTLLVSTTWCSYMMFWPCPVTELHCSHLLFGGEEAPKVKTISLLSVEMTLCYHMIIVFFSTSTTKTSVNDTHFVLALTPAFYLAYGPFCRTEGYADAFHSCLDVDGSAEAEQTRLTSKHKNTDPRIVRYNRQVSSTMLLCLDLLFSCWCGGIHHGSCSCDNSRGLLLNGLCRRELWLTPSLTFGLPGPLLTNTSGLTHSQKSTTVVFFYVCIRTYPGGRKNIILTMTTILKPSSWSYHCMHMLCHLALCFFLINHQHTYT